MNIHLMDNEKFIPQFIERFNRYHSENYYFIIKNSKKAVVNENSSKVIYISPNSVEIENKIHQILVSSNSNVEVNLLVHYLTSVKAEVVNKLKKAYEIRTFWIFYGADLYDKLQKDKSWDLIEDLNPSQKTLTYSRLKILFHRLLFRNKKKERKNELLFILNLDYFCFWNPGDFHLLTSNYSTNAKYRLFLYNHISESSENKNFKYKPGVILINHSASEYGNHLTVLKALNSQEIKSRLNKIILPLSYGSKAVQENVVGYSQKHFEGKIVTLTDFIPKADYEKILNSVSVAIFGHKRQQAGFNIFYLLTLGVKVILREENNLFEYLSSKGVKVFLFSPELTPKSIINDLSMQEKLLNRKIILELFSKNKVDTMYRDLIN